MQPFRSFQSWEWFWQTTKGKQEITLFRIDKWASSGDIEQTYTGGNMLKNISVGHAWWKCPSTRSWTPRQVRWPLLMNTVNTGAQDEIIDFLSLDNMLHLYLVNKLLFPCQSDSYLLPEVELEKSYRSPPSFYVSHRAPCQMLDMLDSLTLNVKVLLQFSWKISCTSQLLMADRRGN